MKKFHRVVALTLATAAIAAAQTTTTTPAADGPSGPRRGGPGGPGGHGPGRGPAGHPVVRALDTNHNGELSTDEIDAAGSVLGARDANSDGSVTFDELHPPRPAAAPKRPANATRPARPAPPAGAPKIGDGDRRRPVDPVMLALDADQNHALSSTEIANAPASLRALDLNKDGKLTADELRPLPPAE